ncbi:MAG: hypothetical protein E6K81_16580, partial [Candidatus Eisenbacteria bacterium]
MKSHQSVLSRLALVAGTTFVMLTSIAAMAAAATYTWNQTGTASWATSTNWTPTRTTPATSDVMVFNNGATTTATSVPTQTIGQLLVSGGTTVTLDNGATAITLTVGSGIAGTDLSVASGSALNVSASGNAVFTMNIPTGNTGSISGSMTWTAASLATINQFTTVDASGLTINSGGSIKQGQNSTGNLFGTAGSTL